MSNLERKFSKYAIKNLSLILIICYAFGYLVSMFDRSGSIMSFLSLNPYLILKGQVWRLVTWVIIPPDNFDLLVLITLYFYYSIGKSLERVWGDWLYNVYIFSGFLFTILGSFIMLGVFVLKPEWMPYASLDLSMKFLSLFCFSTYYVNMSIFLAFAATFPEAKVLLMFFIPVKVKWLGVIYGVILGYTILNYITAGVGGWYFAVAIICSLLNFGVFFLVQQNRLKGTPKMRFEQAARRRNYEKEVRRSTSNNGFSKHKCAICGRTELDSPDLQFRFCSRCNGNYEYCEEHIFNHKHVEG